LALFQYDSKEGITFGKEKSIIVVVITVYAWCVCVWKGGKWICVFEMRRNGRGEGRNEVPSYSASSSVTATIHRVAW